MKVYKVVGEHPGGAKMGCGCRSCKNKEYFIVPQGLDELVSMCEKCIDKVAVKELVIMEVEATKLREWKP